MKDDFKNVQRVEKLDRGEKSLLKKYPRWGAPPFERSGTSAQFPPLARYLLVFFLWSEVKREN